MDTGEGVDDRNIRLFISRHHTHGGPPKPRSEDANEKALYTTLNNFRTRTQWGATLSPEQAGRLNTGAPWAVDRGWARKKTTEKEAWAIYVQSAQHRQAHDNRPPHKITHSELYEKERKIKRWRQDLPLELHQKFEALPRWTWTGAKKRKTDVKQELEDAPTDVDAPGEVKQDPADAPADADMPGEDAPQEVDNLITGRS